MKKRYVIAVDIGGTVLKSALVSITGKIAYLRKAPTPRVKDKTKLIESILSSINDMILIKKLKKRDILGIGIGAPGPVDSLKGVVHYFVNIPGWREVPLKRIIEGKTGIPVFIDNDVNMMALGELKFGAGRNAKNMVCITLGTGVGGGIVIDGKLYRGSGSSAGEVGHITVAENGPLCNCGNKGCLERLVGNRYIVSEVRNKIRDGAKTSISRMVNGRLSDITPEMIDKAAGKGDRFAIGIWKNTGHYIGTALADIANILDPEAIVIGGGMANAGKGLFDSIRETVRARAMKGPAERVRIVRAKLGYDAGLIGAVPLVLSKGR